MKIMICSCQFVICRLGDLDLQSKEKSANSKLSNIITKPSLANLKIIAKFNLLFQDVKPHTTMQCQIKKI